MIQIRTIKNKHVFKYEGDIELFFDIEFLHVSGYQVFAQDDLITADYKIYDMFYHEDIKSIVGK